MPQIIVTGVDGTDTALKAARRAATFAAAFGAELHVLSAFLVKMQKTIQTVQSKNLPEDKAEAYQSVVSEAEQKALDTATAAVEELRSEFPDLKMIPKAVEGPPGAAISGEADLVGADMIVVGNKRVQGPTRIFGSVARAIARETDADLHIVNTHQR